MTLRIDILTLFPAFFDSPLRESLLGRAIREELVDVRVSDIRDHARDRHRQVDDASFGGGPGMVMKPAPVVEKGRGWGHLGGHRRTWQHLFPGFRTFGVAGIKFLLRRKSPAEGRGRGG